MIASRKLWVSLVERAVASALASGKPIDIGQILDSVGVLSWAPYRTEAYSYATTLLETHHKVNRTRKGRKP